MKDGPPPDWPHRDVSQMVHGPVHRWHVQQRGDDPDILLLHGAGGSTHSFRDLFEILTDRYRVTMVDLPGHGFTQLGGQRRSGLTAMATDLSALLTALEITPTAIIGHSAGAAIALELAKDRPDLKLVGINPALQSFSGLAGLLFPMMARVLAATPFTARLFSGTSSQGKRTEALIAGTGSDLSAEGIALYRRLIASERHVNGALSMMAQWSLDDLINTLPQISCPTLFIAGTNDKTVPARIAKEAAAKMPNATFEAIDGLGHLMHEEAPDLIADHILRFLEPA